MKTLGEQLRDGPSEEVWIISASESVEVTKRKATPGGAEYAEPRYSVEGIEGGSGEGQRIEDLGAGGELFEIDGAEGDCRFAKGHGDWSQRVASAAEDGDSIVLSFGAGCIHAIHVAAD
jgi:hypothetical protein